jgi:phosphoglycerate dehydrogenase-like enzyme
VFYNKKLRSHGAPFATACGEAGTDLMKLIIKTLDADGRLALVPTFLDPPWEIEAADPDRPDAFARAMRGADAFVSMTWREPMPPAPALKLLQLPGAGTDDVEFQHVPPHTAVCNCFEHEIGIAEFVLGAMLEWTIDIRGMDARLRRGDWRGSYLCGPRHVELHGRTLGILGYGRIGREVARRAQAFGMRLRVVSRTPRAGDEFAGEIEGMQRLGSLLEQSDFVVVTLPLTDSTAGLLDAGAFARMKRSAILINVSRGAVIEERALFDALASGRIAGAVIDVWYRYPPQERPEGHPYALPFHTLPNILMTPHASAWTDGLLPRRNRAIAENLNRLARGLPLLNVVRAPPRSAALAGASS